MENSLPYLNDISSAAYGHLQTKYLTAFQEMNKRIDNDLQDVPGEEVEQKKKGHYLFKLYQKMERHLKITPRHWI